MMPQQQSHTVLPRLTTTGGMHQQQFQTVVPRLPTGNRIVLSSRWDSVDRGDMLPQIDFGTQHVTELIVSDTEAMVNKTFLTIIALLNSTPTEATLAIQGYYVSAIVCLIPDLEEVFVEALRANSIAVSKIRLPSQAAENNITMATETSGTKTPVMLGQLLIMLFKNLTPVNYHTFMETRILAMKSILGITIAESQLRAIADIEKVNVIWSVFGQNRKVRQEVLRKIIDGCRERYPFGNLYTYLSEILAWTDLAAFTLIFDTLVKPGSPVLKHPMVQNEVRAFAEALYAVTHYEYPQFYRILGPARGALLLVRARYPILLAVAQRIKAERYTTVNQFATSRNHHEHAFVNELYHMHKMHFRGRMAVEENAALRFLTRRPGALSETTHPAQTTQGGVAT